MSEYTYEFVTSGLGHTALVRSDGAVIPESLDNSDYQRYLNPEAEQSTPIVTDEAKTK
jgi:hypothetical protein